MPTKQRIFLAVLFLFGVPAIVTTVLLTSSAHHEAVDGTQPGGLLRGMVRDETGRALARIEVDAFAVGPDGARTRVSTVLSGENGAFEIVVPPMPRGHFELVAGGGERLPQAIPVSQVDRTGKVAPTAPLEFNLGPGSRLDVVFAHADGSPAGEGTFALEGAADTGLLPGWSGVRFQRHGSFVAGTLGLENLPPVRVRLQVRMASGEKVDLMLDLAPGKNRHQVVL